MARGLLNGDSLQRLQDLSEPGELHLVRTLVGHGLCSGPDLAAALADHWQLGRVDLSRSEVDLMPLVVLSRTEAIAHLVLPFSASGQRLHVAVASPEAAAEFAPELGKRSGLKVQLYVAPLGELMQTIASAYQAADSGQRAWQGQNFPKKAGRTSLQACAVTPYRANGEAPHQPALQQRAPSSRGAWSTPTPPTEELVTPPLGTPTPVQLNAVRRSPLEELLKRRTSSPPPPRRETLANDIASALAELGPDASEPLIAAPPPPVAAPPAEAAQEPEEVRTGLRSLVHKIKTVANTEVPLPFMRPQTGAHKALTSAGKSVPPSPKSVPPSARTAPPGDKVG